MIDVHPYCHSSRPTPSTLTTPKKSKTAEVTKKPPRNMSEMESETNPAGQRLGSSSYVASAIALSVSWYLFSEQSLNTPMAVQSP